MFTYSLSKLWISGHHYLESPLLPLKSCHLFSELGDVQHRRMWVSTLKQYQAFPVNAKRLQCFFLTLVLNFQCLQVLSTNEVTQNRAWLESSAKSPHSVWITKVWGLLLLFFFLALVTFCIQILGFPPSQPHNVHDNSHPQLSSFQLVVLSLFQCLVFRSSSFWLYLCFMNL